MHVSSSTEGFYVMHDEHTGVWANDCVAGPFPSQSAAEDYAAFIRPNGEFDTSKLLGTLNGTLAGNRHNLLSAKRYFETHGAMDTMSPEHMHWQRLDDMICRIDALEAVFQAYVTGGK